MPRYCRKGRPYLVTLIISRFERYVMENESYRLHLLKQALKEDGTLDYRKLNNSFLRWMLVDDRFDKERE